MKFTHMSKHITYFARTESGDVYMLEDDVWYEQEFVDDWVTITDDKQIQNLNQAWSEKLNEI